MTKREVRKLADEELAVAFMHIQNELRDRYPSTEINYNFNKTFYKKHDTANIKKMKVFNTLLRDLFLLIQELRSRGLSMMDIIDQELRDYGPGILTKSFKD